MEQHRELIAKMTAAALAAARLAALIIGATRETIYTEARKAAWHTAPTDGAFAENYTLVDMATNAAMLVWTNLTALTPKAMDDLVLELPMSPRVSRAQRLARLQRQRLDKRRARRLVRLVLAELEATNGRMPTHITRKARMATERLRIRYPMRPKKGT
jgi:hypothetical protein